MQIIAATSKKQKEEVKEAAEAFGLSQSAFIKLAVTKEIIRMHKEGILPKKEN